MNEHTNSGKNGGKTRRKYLKLVGAGATTATIGSQSVSASKADLKVVLCETKYPYPNAPDVAEDAVREVGNELGVGTTVYRSGSIGVESPSSPASYQDMIDLFKNNASNETCPGYMNILLYSYPLQSDEYRTCGCNGAYSAEAKVGALKGTYQYDVTPHAVVNTRIKGFDTTTYKNMVKHEVLHGLLDKQNAPSSGDDHTYGNTWLDETLGGHYATPMISGYVESVSNNTKPATTCEGSDPATTDFHDGALSDCTKSEAKRWLKEEY